MHLLQLLHLDSVNDVDFIPPTVALPHMHAGVSLLWSDRQAKGWGKDGECDEGESSKLANECEGDVSDSESECSEEDSSSDEEAEEDAQKGGRSKRKADKEPELTRKLKKSKSTNGGRESAIAADSNPERGGKGCLLK